MNAQATPEYKVYCSSVFPDSIRLWILVLSFTLLENLGFAQATTSLVNTNRRGAEGESIISLSPFMVTSDKEVGYGAATSGASGRLRQEYIDTPQMISVVTSELMEDAKLFDSLDVIRFVPNVESNAVHFPSTSIRGLQTDRTYFDGFYVGSKLDFDTAFFDRIEIVKGPSSTAFGRGDPAGFLNFVTKSPLFERSTRTGITIGSGNGNRQTMRYTLDNNGLVSQDGKTAYRFVGAYARGSGTRDFSEYERAGALLSVDRQLGSGTSIKVTGNLSRNHNAGLVGNTSFIDPSFQKNGLDVSRNTTQNVPLLDPDYVFGFDGTGFTENAVGLVAVLQARLSDHWNTRQAVRYTDANRFGVLCGSNIGSVRREADGTLTIQITPIQLSTKYKGWSYQGDVITSYESNFLDSKYTLLFGGDFSDESSYSSQQAAVVNRQPLLNPNRSTPYSFTSDPDKIGILSTGTQWSSYVQTEGAFFSGKLTISAAVRKIIYDREAKNLLNGAITPDDVTSPLLPTYSLLYKPFAWLSFFALHSEYLEPATIKPIYTGLPVSDPRFLETFVVQPSTTLKEVGIKGSILNGKLTFSVAAFQTDSTGGFRTITFDPVNLYQKNFLSEDRFKGWEAEVFGRPTKRLTIMLGAGFKHSRINAANGDSILIVNSSGVDTIYGNAKYNFGDSHESGLSTTVGFKTTLSGFNAAQGFLGNRPYPDSTTAVDLGLIYSFKKGRDQISIRANNAFTKHAQIAGTGQYMRDGRQIFVSYETRF